MVQTIFGRDALVKSALGVLDAGQHVSISGAEGVGTTTVLNLLTASLQTLGQTPVVIRPVSPEHAFSALDALTGYVRPDQRFDALCAALPPSVGSSLAPVLLIDDAHLLDTDSAAAVRQVVSAGRARIVVAIPRPHRTTSSILRLSVEPTTQHFDVGELDATSARQMLATLLPGTTERRTSDLLVQVSGGNPSLLRALVEGSKAAGTLASIRDTWRSTGALRCSSNVSASVLQPLRDLADRERRVLDTLALTGPISLDLAHALFVDEDLETLERRELVVAIHGEHSHDSSTSIRLTSAVMAVVLNDSAGPLVRRRIFRDIAEACERVGLSDNASTLLWRVRGGVDLDPALLLAGARAASSNNDPEAAAELAKAAYDSTRSTDAAILCIRSLAMIGRDIEASRLAELALTAARGPFDRAALAGCLAEEAWWFGRDANEALDRAFEPDVPLGEWSALVDAKRTVFATMDGDLAAAEPSRQLRHHPLAAVRLMAGSVASQLESMLGNPEEALAIAEAMLIEANSSDLDAEARALSDPGVHVVGMLTALLHSARLDEAIQLAEVVRDMTIATPSARIRAWTATMLAQACAHAGRPATAARRFSEAEVLWADCGLIGPGSWASVGLAQTLAELGDLDGARAAMGRSLERERRGFRLMEPTLWLAKAWTEKLAGNESLALSAASDAIDAATKIGAPVHHGAIAHSLARLGLTVHAQRAVEAAADLASPMGNRQLGFARAVIAADPLALELNAEQWTAVGAALYAAEAYALAAQMYRTRRDLSRATRMDGVAGKLLASADANATPPLRQRRASGALTPRLTEVAQLAAEGLRAAEIAERLVLSERSVESHLQRIYQRLGIRSRADLSAELKRLSQH